MESSKRELAREKALQDVKLYLANDWQLKEETPEFFLLERNNAKVFWHLVILVFTFGVGNIIYHFVSKEKKKIII